MSFSTLLLFDLKYRVLWTFIVVGLTRNPLIKCTDCCVCRSPVHPQGLRCPRWQQLASRPLSVSPGLCCPEEPLARADAIFKVTMLPGDGVGPELMTAVKDVFKVCLTVMEMESLLPFFS